MLGLWIVICGHIACDGKNGSLFTESCFVEDVVFYFKQSSTKIFPFITGCKRVMFMKNCVACVGNINE